MPLRDARRDEVPVIVQWLADDQLGKDREDSSDIQPYLEAFDAIAASKDNLLLVWEEDDKIMGCLQLTYVPGLTLKGTWRALIEGVRVARDSRNQGIGERMIRAAINMARARGCALVELTTNKRRVDAHRFYQRIGFAMSHEGMKLTLTP